jgi:hypothetical protein
MAPAKKGRRAATPASEESTKAATEDSTELLGPDGEPVAEEPPTRDDGGDSAPPTETGQVDRDDRAKKQSPGRSPGLYPLPVWPD